MDNVEKYGKARQPTDDYTMAHARCVRDTYGYIHSFYVILIDFPQQQWLRERALMLRYTCVIYLVVSSSILVSPSKTIFFFDVS